MSGVVAEETGQASKKARLTNDASGQDLDLDIGRALFKSRDASGDVEFEVGTNSDSHKIFAHACILKQRSDVWKAALREGGFKESENRKIRIEDVDPIAFLMFLEMLYTAKLSLPEEDSIERVMQVAMLADRYGVVGFGKMVQSALASLITWGKIDVTVFEQMCILSSGTEYHKAILSAVIQKCPAFTPGSQDIDFEHCSELIESFDEQIAAVQKVSTVRGMSMQICLATACQRKWISSLRKSTAPAASMRNAFKYLEHMVARLPGLSLQLASST